MTETLRAPLAIRRRNRKWMVLMMLTPVVFGVSALLELTSSGPPEPKVNPVTIPVGYRAITDAYFGYAIPKGWQENEAFTDGAGDFLYGGAGGWAGESLTILKTSPDPTAAPPRVIGVFGQAQYTPFTVVSRRPISIPNAGYTWEYDLSRQDGSSAVAINVWVASAQTNMWLEIDATPAITTAISSSLQTYAVRTGS